MKKNIFKVSLILLLAFSLTSTIHAQGTQTGSISGVVSDPDGNLLPGATVTLTGTGIMGSLTYITGDTGRFRFPALIPGTCELKIEMAGFKTYIRKGLLVQVGKTTEVRIVLIMTTIEESVTVTAESPVVDVETSKINVHYSSDFLATIPMNRDLYGIQNSIPGAISEGVDYRRTSSILGGTVRSQLYQVDGVPFNDPATFYPMANINVDVYEEIEFAIGSLPADVGQADSVVVNIVTKAGGNKFSGSAGAYFTTSSFSQELLNAEDRMAVGANPPESYKDYKDGTLSFGGPIIQDRAWFFVNGRRLVWGQANPQTYDVRLKVIADARPGMFTEEELQHFDILHREWLGFGKLTFQLSKNLRYMGMYHWNNIYEPVYSNRTSNTYTFACTIVWDHENTHITTHQMNWIIDQNTFVDARGTYVHRHFPILLRPEYAMNYFVYDRAEAVRWGNSYYGDDYIRKKTLASVALTHFADDLLGASHEMKIGGEYEGTIYGLDRYKDGNPYYTYWRDFLAGDKYYYSTSGHRGRLRVRPFAPRGTVWKYDNTRRFSGYVEDSIVTGRLAINLGLRLDYGYQYEPEQSRPDMIDLYDIGPEFLNPALNATPTILLHALNDQYHNDSSIEFNQTSAFDALTTPYKKIVEFTTLSPRIGVVYDLFGDGKTAIKASFSRLYEPIWSAKYNASNTMSGGAMNWYWYDLNQNGYMDLPRPGGAYGSPVQSQYLDDGVTNDPDGDGLPGDQYRLTSYDVQDPNYMYYPPDLKAPYMHEFIVGVEHELVRDFKMGLQFIYKENKNIVEDVDKYNGYDPDHIDEATGLPTWIPYNFTDPGWDGEWGTEDDHPMTVYGLASYAPTRTYEGANPPEAKRTYTALVLTFDKRMSNRWQLNGSLVFSAFRGNTDPGYSATEGESTMFDNPNVMINNYGRLVFDRPFQLKVVGSVILPYDIIFTAYFQARSGSPWGRDIARVYFPSSIDTQDTYIGVSAEKNGSRRDAPYTSLDIRVEKAFAISDVGKLSLFIDGFNIMGRSGYSITANPAPYIHPPEGWSASSVEYELSSTYGDVTSCYGVRWFRLGAKFSF